MPAYSFKERFVPMVEDGSKPGTIRGYRKNQLPKVGQIAYLYFGLRTKWCRKLGEAPITLVHSILIEENERVHICEGPVFDKNNSWELTDEQKQWLAWTDGFRTKDVLIPTPFQIMIRWWKSTHSLPFEGNYIWWGNKKKFKLSKNHGSNIHARGI